MSKTRTTSVDIFRLIADKGPLTLYSANSESDMPIGTIHRHFKELKESGRIRVYKKGKGKRRKIPYGPTVYGFISQYSKDQKIADRIENYFLLWVEHQDFIEELLKEGFSPETIRRPNSAKKLFRKYIHYCSAIEEKIEEIKSGKTTVPHEVLLFVSGLLLMQDSQYMNLWSELYSKIPGLRKTMDDYMENSIKSYNRFKKELALE